LIEESSRAFLETRECATELVEDDIIVYLPRLYKRTQALDAFRPAEELICTKVYVATKTLKGVQALWLEHLKVT
jgi:hypothetical protein